MHNKVYEESVNSYIPAYFELYDEKGNLLLPPVFSDKDISIISSVTQFEKEDIREQINKNIFH